MTEATQATIQERTVGGAYEPLLRSVMPELDTLRGMAILGVLFLHGFFWPYSGLHFGRLGTLWLNITQPGWLGVNLFFVLSGFLITGILIDSAAGPDYYRRFYTRRALRIFTRLLCIADSALVAGASPRSIHRLGFCAPGECQRVLLRGTGLRPTLVIGWHRSGFWLRRSL